MSLLRASGLTVARDARVLCQALDLDLRSGECWALLGGNGSGKTTLLLTLAGLLPPAAGTILLDGRPLAGMPRRAVAQRLGLLPQDSADPFPATVLETALIGRHPHLGPWQNEGPADLALARRALAAMHLTDMESRRCDTLSGGERRRLACATLLTQDPALMLLDEPTNHLDLHHQVLLLERLRQAAAGGKAVLMSLHDPNLAARYCSHALLLPAAGEWEAGPCAELLTGERLSRLYGHPIAELRDGTGLRAFVPH